MKFLLVSVLTVYLFALLINGGLVREKRESRYFLPDKASDLLSDPLDESFVCSEEGIYADINNNCEMFHMCQLTARPDGSGSDLRQYTFVCGNQTVFSQFTMTCTSREEALPCSSATQYYDLNKRVQEGRKDLHLHREEDVEALAGHRRPTNN